MSNPFDQKKPILNVQHIIVVGSGKGGVGKSTVSLNLAVALSKLGLKTGLLDADLYGPSVPRLTGTIYLKPELNQSNKLLPIRRYGINLMSMGHLVEEESPLVWRGPMLFKAIEQFFRDVHWGSLDVLVIDLPPGTGDVALTIAQKVPVSGGIVVSTPQNLSLTDTKKALNMFRQIEIPVIGVVENMSYYLSDKKERVSEFNQSKKTAQLEKINQPKKANKSRTVNQSEETVNKSEEVSQSETENQLEEVSQSKLANQLEPANQSEKIDQAEVNQLERIDLFPRGQIDIYLKEKKIDKLAVIPFHPHVGLSCEAGVPLLESHPNSEEGKAILSLAEKVKKYLQEKDEKA